MTATYWRDCEPCDYAVVGDPVERSLSPMMHSHAYAALGLQLTYRAVTVPAGELGEAAEALRGRGTKGLNVTVPLKEEAFRIFGGDEPRAEATNTVCLLTGCGWNTDIGALADDLAGRTTGPALVVGAGGAARAAVLALAGLGVETAYWSRRAGALDDWAGRHGLALHAVGPSVAGYGLVVNTTSAGHSGSVPELDWSGTQEGALAYDLSYGTAAQPFLDVARSNGMAVRDGLHMLAGQGAMSAAKWLGIEPPFALMREALGCR